MAANLIIASVNNRTVQLKLTVFQDNLRFCVEDTAGGKFHSILNVGVKIDFVTAVLAALNEAKLAQDQTSLTIGQSVKDEQGNIRLGFQFTISKSQSHLYTVNVHCEKGNFDFPLLSDGLIGDGSGPLPEKKRSLIKLDSFINQLSAAYQTLNNIKQEKLKKAEEMRAAEGGGQQAQGGGFRQNTQGGFKPYPKQNFYQKPNNQYQN